MSELTALDGNPEQIKLSSGSVVLIEDLKARQFFKFLRIITHGAMPILADLKLFQMDDNMDAGEFSGRLLSALLLSVPDAEDEAIDFVQSMIKPVGLIEGRRLNKADTERNNALWASIEEELENPELDDLISIIEAVVRREAADIQALGKRLAGMFKLAQKTGQIPASTSPNQTLPTVNSSADSADPSTSSQPHTDGPTTGSPTFPSNDSGNASQPSTNGTGTQPTETVSS